MSKITPTTTASIGGKEYKLRWDKAALFRLGSQPEGMTPVNEEDSAATFRRAIIFAWSMVKASPFKEPEQLAEAVNDDELGQLMEAVAKAITAATPATEGEDGPLASGPSAVVASD